MFDYHDRYAFTANSSKLMVIAIASEMHRGFSTGEDFFYLEGLHRAFLVR